MFVPRVFSRRATYRTLMSLVLGSGLSNHVPELREKDLSFLDADAPLQQLPKQFFIQMPGFLQVTLAALVGAPALWRKTLSDLALLVRVRVLCACVRACTRVCVCVQGFLSRLIW